jgi:hypothetical protein
MKYALDDDARAIFAAIARGEDVELEWKDERGWWPVAANIMYYAGCKLRLKQRTININGYEVPEPMRVEPKIGSNYYLVYFFWEGDGENFQSQWKDSIFDKRMFRAGMCHAKKESAVLHSKALRSFTEVK